MDKPLVPPSPEVWLEELRRMHPGKSEAWVRTLAARLIHYALHDGDMEEAPEFPDDNPSKAE